MKDQTKGISKGKAAGGGRRRRPEAAARQRRIYTPEERREAIEAHEKSQLTQQQFCKTWGISPASLAKWRPRYL
jgi:transposase-like protein